jgi:glycosyltransferase involved in cell wall biosynthesis
MAHQLSKLDVIIPQNEVLTNAYRVFYGLNNCHTLRNFRDVEIVEKKDIHSNKDGILRVVYASRITENKGIFDLLFAVADINQKSHSPLLVLDIYGDIQLQGQLLTKFNDYLGPQISYKGVLDNRAIVQTISEYDLFCLPTKYHGEGTPGVLLESFFAGTPALISSFSHAKHLIQNGFDGIIYDINDPKDLRQKMADIISNKTILEKIRVNVQKTAEKYTFEANKKDFIYFITGEVL